MATVEISVGVTRKNSAYTKRTAEKRDEQRSEQEKKAQQVLHTKVEVQMVASARPEVVRNILIELLDAGEIKLPGLTADEDVKLDEVDEFGGNLNLEDDDEPREVPNPAMPAFADCSSPFVAPAYEIVLRRRNGKIAFDAPPNDWAGAIGKNGTSSILRAYSLRMTVYAKIAERLQREFPLDAPNCPGSVVGILGTEKKFKEAMRKGLGKLSNLSDYLRNARLVCGDWSVPLRNLFS